MFFSISIDMIIFNFTRLSLSDDPLYQYFGKVSNPPNSPIKIIDLLAHPLRMPIQFDYYKFLLDMKACNHIACLFFVHSLQRGYKAILRRRGLSASGYFSFKSLIMDSLSARSGIFISEVMLLSFIHRELYH